MADPTPAKPEAPKPEPAPAAAKAAEPAKPADSTAALAQAINALAARTPAPGGVTATEDLDVAPPGGRYRVKDKLVNAHGRELNDDGTLKYPEQQQLDVFGRLV